MKMKKKIISLSFATLVLFTTVASPIYAKESSLLPPWFIEAIKPIQASLNSLFQRTDNHETRIIELEKKVNFEVPTQWSTEFYEASINDGNITTTYIIKMRTSDGFSLTIPNIPPNNCTWNKAIIDLNTTARAVAHLSTGDMFGVGTCREITFKSNAIPASGTTFETDIYLWWQGTEKHTKQTVTIPERPFQSLLTVNNGGSLINGAISSGTIGIGITSPGTYFYPQ